MHGILHARILEWVALSPPEDLPDQGRLKSHALAGGFFSTIPPPLMYGLYLKKKKIISLFDLHPDL